MEKEEKKRVLRKYIFIAFLIISIIISILLMVRYSVEGERNMTFQLSKIVLQSTIDAQSRETANLWDLEITQNNDVYIYIEKNKNIESDEKIKSIQIKNITLKEKPQKGNVAIFLPTSNIANKIFLASTEDYMNKTIEYYANTSDNLERQEICQDGGRIALRISNKKIGEYVSNEGTEVKYDKSILEQAGIQEEEIKFVAEMDLIIETSEDAKYKATIPIELPIDTFENSGVINKEINDFSKIIFKRSE